MNLYTRTTESIHSFIHFDLYRFFWSVVDNKIDNRQDKGNYQFNMEIATTKKFC